jgi:hypothetical protein
VTLTAEEKKYLEEPYTHRPIVSSTVDARIPVGGCEADGLDWPHLIAARETVESRTASMHLTLTAIWREHSQRALLRCMTAVACPVGPDVKDDTPLPWR